MRSTHPKIMISLILSIVGVITSVYVLGENMPEQSQQTAKPDKLSTAIFAGGCFWCMEPAFDMVEGVISTTSGYIDGHIENPTYDDVSYGQSGHTEALQVAYNPAKVSYSELLTIFWVNIDPLTADAQFCDYGTQYRSGIYYKNDSQKQAAWASLKQVKKKFKEPVVTEIKKATIFYPAENYHQNYYIKNPVRYKFYRWRCGRDARLQELWGDTPLDH